MENREMTLEEIFKKHRCDPDFGDRGMVKNTLEADLFFHIEALQKEVDELKLRFEVVKNEKSKFVGKYQKSRKEVEAMSALLAQSSDAPLYNEWVKLKQELK
jgi:hypothetical protein